MYYFVVVYPGWLYVIPLSFSFPFLALLGFVSLCNDLYVTYCLIKKKTIRVFDSPVSRNSSNDSYQRSDSIVR